MSEERKAIAVEDLVDEDLINRAFFISLLNAMDEKKRILLVGQPGAHGLTTLVMALLIHGDTKGFKYEIFDVDVTKDKEQSDKQYLAHLQNKKDIYAFFSAWAKGASGVATIYADSVEDALNHIESSLKEHGIADPKAYTNFTTDVICMIENENGTDSVVRDVIMQHN